MHVGPRAGAGAGELLGRRVVRRERRLARPGVGIPAARDLVQRHDLRDAEIQQPRPRPAARSDQHDVGGLQVAVGDAGLVRGDHRLDDVAQEPEGLHEGAPAPAAPLDEGVLEGLPGEPLQHHERSGPAGGHVRRAEVEHLQDARVVEPRDGLRLRCELLDELLAPRAQAIAVHTPPLWRTASARTGVYTGGAPSDSRRRTSSSGSASRDSQSCAGSHAAARPRR